LNTRYRTAIDMVGVFAHEPFRVAGVGGGQRVGAGVPHSLGASDEQGRPSNPVRLPGKIVADGVPDAVGGRLKFPEYRSPRATTAAARSSGPN
jgi:hypothetical protein